MTSVIPKKLLQAVVTLLLATFIASLLTELLPGDPAQVIAGDTATPEQVEQIRTDLNLDDSFIVRYGHLLGNLVQGDLGNSVKMAPGTPVTTLISDALPTTFSLIAVTLFWTMLISIPLGYLAARKVGTAFDRGITFVTTVGAGVPNYVLALSMIVFLAVDHQWFPAIGYTPLGDGVWPWLHSIILPSIALGIVAAAQLTKVTRASFLEVLNREYTRLTVAKGMSRRSVIWKHSLRNASTPIITMIGLQAARLIGGTLIVEGIFVMPGLGRIALEAVNGRDMVVIQGVVIFATIFVLLVNLLVDVIELTANPRSRMGTT